MRKIAPYFTLRNLPALLVIAACLVWLWLPQETAFRRETIRIESGAQVWPFTVEIAETSWQRMQGLMQRQSLEENAGMLFLSAKETEMPMWMKNTPLSLDMLFLDNAGTVVYIAQRTEPYSLKTISAGRKVRAVLEVPAGTVARYHIKVGDKVAHPAFSPHPG